MYNNFKAEMKRRGITNEMLSKRMKSNPASISRKLNGKQKLTVTDAKAMRKIVAPDETLDYLFGEG